MLFQVLVSYPDVARVWSNFPFFVGLRSLQFTEGLNNRNSYCETQEGN